MDRLLKEALDEEWPRCRWCGTPVEWRDGWWVRHSTENPCCFQQAKNPPVWGQRLREQADDLDAMRRIQARYGEEQT